MHLAFICNEYPPAPHGGIGSSNKDLAEGLAALGHRVTVLGVYAPKHIPANDLAAQPPGLTVVRLQGTPARWGYKTQMLLDRWRLRRRLAALHARDPFDLIETSDFGGWLPWGGAKDLVLVSRLQGTNLLFDHELHRLGNKFEHRLERRSLMRANFWISLSSFGLQRTRELCNIHDKPGIVIHHAVDTELFSPAEDTPTQPGLVVFVNSLNPKKGIEQLVDAMNFVCASHPHARLAVVGQDTQPAKGKRSYVEQLRERVRPEFRARIEFTGRLDRQTGVVNYLRRAHVCCLPSHMETFGIAAVEAMAVGKPVIYSRTGPGPEVIEDEVSGLLCNPCDAGDIARRITRLLDSPILAARLAQGARARVLAMFDKKDWIDRNLDCYRRCLGQPGQPSLVQPSARV